MAFIFVLQHWDAVYKVSSKPENLIDCFAFVRNVTSFVSLLTALHIGVFKKPEFVKLLIAIEHKITTDSNQPRNRIYFLETSILVAFILATYLLLNNLLFQQGIYANARELSLIIFKGPVNMGIFPFNTTYLVHEFPNSLMDYVSMYSLFLLTVKTYMSLMTLTVFNLVYVHFVRSNVTSFRKAVEKLTTLEILSTKETFDVRLFLKIVFGVLIC